MKKNLTLAEVKSMYNEKCFETENNFGFNDFGKYRPNMTFIIPKEFTLAKNGKPINPIAFVSDREITDNMNVDWDGDAQILFGDFWESNKGGACFRPKNPLHAKHLLIGVDWGGSFNSHHGSYGNSDALYFRRAASNGGGSGVDYWVFPVGYSQILRDEEIDGDAPASDRSKMFEERAKAYRQKHADRQRLEIEDADRFLRQKAVAEIESKKAKVDFLPRLEVVEARLSALRETSEHVTGSIAIDGAYFNLDNTEYLFSEENVAKAEARVRQLEIRVAENEAKELALAKATAQFVPQLEQLTKRIQACGWKLEIGREMAKISESYDRYYNGHTFHEEQKIAEFPFSETGIAYCVKLIETQEVKLAEERAALEAEAKRQTTDAEAKALGLPSDVRIWHRSGATNAGKGWVIQPNGMDRDYDKIECPRPRYGSEGDAIWQQILPGEVALRWAHSYTAAPHEFEVIYHPDTLTPAQEERIAEIEQELENQFLGQSGLTGKSSCPSVGDGWGLVQRCSPDTGDSAMAQAMRKAGITK